jgi:hypothetical protein
MREDDSDFFDTAEFDETIFDILSNELIPGQAPFPFDSPPTPSSDLRTYELAIITSKKTIVVFFALPDGTLMVEEEKNCDIDVRKRDLTEGGLSSTQTQNVFHSFRTVATFIEGMKDILLRCASQRSFVHAVFFSHPAFLFQMLPHSRWRRFFFCGDFFRFFRLFASRM